MRRRVNERRGQPTFTPLDRSHGRRTQNLGESISCCLPPSMQQEKPAPAGRKREEQRDIVSVRCLPSVSHRSARSEGGRSVAFIAAVSGPEPDARSSVAAGPASLRAMLRSCPARCCVHVPRGNGGMQRRGRPCQGQTSLTGESRPDPTLSQGQTCCCFVVWEKPELRFAPPKVSTGERHRTATMEGGGLGVRVRGPVCSQ